MENYIIKEFMDSNSERKSEKKPKRNNIDYIRRKKVIEVFEQANGFMGPEEIADALDIDIEKVKGYLGKTRIERYERLKSGEDIENSEEENRGKSKSDKVSDVTVKQPERLTANRVKKLADERNSRIIAMHAEGLSIEEIASKERLTLDQAKEIFLSLGLSIYTQEEILEMRRKAEEERKNREEAERLERKRSRQRTWIREKRAKIKAEKQRQEAERKEEETGVVLIRNFEDLKRAMRLLLKQGKSKQAIELGEHFLDDENILSGEEKSSLFLSIEELKEIRKAYKRREKREKRERKIETSRNGENEQMEEK